MEQKFTKSQHKNKNWKVITFTVFSIEGGSELIHTLITYIYMDDCDSQDPRSKFSANLNN